VKCQKNANKYDDEEWRKLHNEKLCGMHSSPDMMNRSGRERWICRILRGTAKERFHFENPGTPQRMILKQILKK
jgi:hypothetical protein